MQEEHELNHSNIESVKQSLENSDQKITQAGATNLSVPSLPPRTIQKIHLACHAILRSNVKDSAKKDKESLKGVKDLLRKKINANQFPETLKKYFKDNDYDLVKGECLKAIDSYLAISLGKRPNPFLLPPDYFSRTIKKVSAEDRNQVKTHSTAEELTEEVKNDIHKVCTNLLLSLPKEARVKLLDELQKNLFPLQLMPFFLRYPYDNVMKECIDNIMQFEASLPQNYECSLNEAQAESRFSSGFFDSDCVVSRPQAISDYPGVEFIPQHHTQESINEGMVLPNLTTEEMVCNIQILQKKISQLEANISEVRMELCRQAELTTHYLNMTLETQSYLRNLYNWQMPADPSFPFVVSTYPNNKNTFFSSQNHSLSTSPTGEEDTLVSFVDHWFTPQ